MSRMISMYLAGFGSVWAAVALVWAAIASFRHFDRDWDRAFTKELRELEQVETKYR
jgi:hypothetical protein